MKTYFHKALARQVLAVVVLDTSDDGSRGQFACYVDAVAGEKHEDEYMAVAVGGNKQNYDFTKAIMSGLVETLESQGYTYRS